MKTSVKTPNKTTINQIMRRYKVGASIKALGEEFDLSREQVRQVLVDAGVAIRSRGRPAAAQAA